MPVSPGLISELGKMNVDIGRRFSEGLFGREELQLEQKKLQQQQREKKLVRELKFHGDVIANSTNQKTIDRSIDTMADLLNIDRDAMKADREGTKKAFKDILNIAKTNPEHAKRMLDEARIEWGSIPELEGLEEKITRAKGLEAGAFTEEELLRKDVGLAGEKDTDDFTISGGYLLNKKTGATVKLDTGKQYKAHVTLGDRVKIFYNDGSVKEEKVGVKPGEGGDKATKDEFSRYNTIYDNASRFASKATGATPIIFTDPETGRISVDLSNMGEDMAEKWKVAFQRELRKQINIAIAQKILPEKYRAFVEGEFEESPFEKHPFSTTYGTEEEIFKSLRETTKEPVREWRKYLK